MDWTAAESRFDFSETPDEVLFDPDHVYVEGYDKFNKAWRAEMQRRKDAKLDAQLKAEQERMARFMAAKSAIPYSEPIAQEICERISAGEFLINICRDAHTPTMRNVTQWLKQHPIFKALYDDLINDRLNIFEDEVVTIADDSKLDFKIVVKNGKEKRVYDPEVIARAKLRVDVRFKHLKAYRPQRWADTSTLNVKNEDASGTDDLSLQELEKVIADIESKARMVKAVA